MCNNALLTREDFTNMKDKRKNLFMLIKNEDDDEEFNFLHEE